MSLTARILIVFTVVGGLSMYFFLDRILIRIERQYLEAAEEPMVDAANLLSAMVAGDLAGSHPPPWSEAVAEAQERNPHARIYSKLKSRVEMDFYITDAHGVIIYDSSGLHSIGADHSNFLDVYHTLVGRYGARSTREFESDDRSSIMYVGAPIQRNGSIIGVLTVYKPQRSLHEFIGETRRVLQGLAMLAMGAMLVGGILASRWITSPVRTLTTYVEGVAAGNKPKRPRFASRSMDQLANAFEAMRDAVNGRNAIEGYVQTLTHEMKSPIAAIRGAAELLEEPMPDDQRNKFLANIRIETTRLADLSERLLQLSAVESCKELARSETIAMQSLVDSAIDDVRITAETRGVQMECVIAPGLITMGDPELLRLAISNLLQNAIDFSPTQSTITITGQTADDGLIIEIKDQGPGIPDYANDRIFERFYSLPRPASGQKSTGLGLCFVREIALLHGGSIAMVSPGIGGTTAMLKLPIAASSLSPATKATT